MLKLTKRQYGILLALLGATLYAVNAPFSKIVLDYLPPILTAGFLYLGSGLGMLAIASFRSRHGTDNVEKKLDHKEWPYVLAMIVLDIVGPICLMVGLQKTTAANASLLSDFEIVATAILAWLFFQERISKRLWVGIAFVTLSCCVLSCEDMDSLRFSSGSLYVILAAFCWGLDNNPTDRLEGPDADRPHEGYLFWGRHAPDRLSYRGDHRSHLAHLRGDGHRTRLVRPECLHRHLCAADVGRRPHERLLCGRTLHRNGPLAADLPADTAPCLLDRPRIDGGGCLVVRQGFFRR